jgi:hypothetical protein
MEINSPMLFKESFSGEDEMKKYLLSTAISCATLLLATTANAHSSYDGSWSLVFVTQRGACDST